ncbi:MAG: hypothetical protein MSC31_19350 [Solirubrobacteraceae bacterium MAG38_C4-C5]|nr:hypothetical protein [Candidatus Siliceabacter maunaloa]
MEGTLMAGHVDIVKNDWLAGMRYPLASIAIDDQGEVSVDAQFPDRWHDLVEHVRNSEDRLQALSELHLRLSGSHVFATELRDGVASDQRPVYLQGEQASGSASAVPAGR